MPGTWLIFPRPAYSNPDSFSPDAAPAASRRCVIRACDARWGRLGPERAKRMMFNGDKITGHSPEGLNFKTPAEDLGWKQAMDDQDQGRFDRTANVRPPKTNR
ncbi:MAG: hypothetical protein CSA70_08285 [Rhodobacterales bacterium]|nr:MAG: hypothetical protein CSA70_08285 [Rhodobacterales bacterium]